MNPPPSTYFAPVRRPLQDKRRLHHAPHREHAVPTGSVHRIAPLPEFVPPGVRSSSRRPGVRTCPSRSASRRIHHGHEYSGPKKLEGFEPPRDGRLRSNNEWEHDDGRNRGSNPRYDYGGSRPRNDGATRTDACRSERASRSCRPERASRTHGGSRWECRVLGVTVLANSRMVY